MRRFLRVLTVTAVAALALSTSAVPAFAASPSATSLVTTAGFVGPGANLPVFGIDLTAGAGGLGGQCANLAQVLIDFNQVTGGGTFDVDDLEANTDPGGGDAGIELW